MAKQKQEDTDKLVTSNKKQTTSYVSAHGRRKEAIARVKLNKGAGQVLVNGLPINQYFPSKVNEVLWQKPFVLTNSLRQYTATIKVSGSGKSGQLAAVVHGLSRALSIANPEFRKVLKKAKLLTRDSRVKERRKYG